MDAGNGTAGERRLGILYEHPEWFRLLFAELARRGVSYTPLFASEQRFDPAARRPPFALLLNRVSPSSYLRGHANSILYTLQYLAYLRQIGAPVVNGYDAFVVETSKALQLSLFERLGLPYPRARVINHRSQIAAAADGLRYPIMVKPNIGGSGALMRRFDSPAAVRAAVRANEIQLGLDSTALVQEYIAPADGAIVRVEVLDGQYLYAIRLYPEQDAGFNLCPADVCQPPDVDHRPGGQAPGSSVEDQSQDFNRCVLSVASEGGAAQRPEAAEAVATTEAARAVGGDGAVTPAKPAKRVMRIEAYSPPPELVRGAIDLLAAARIDVGGVEYLIGAGDGRPYFYDVNALSNFVSDALRLLGFDPTARFVDYLEQRLAAAPIRAPRSPGPAATESCVAEPVGVAD